MYIHVQHVFFHIHIKTESSSLKHQLNCPYFDQILTKSFPCMIHNLVSFKVFFFTHPDLLLFTLIIVKLFAQISTECHQQKLNAIEIARK